jgi:hypothetical protein
LFTPAAATSASPSGAGGAQYTLQVDLNGLDAVQGSAIVPAANGCVQPTRIAATFGAHLVSLQINVKPQSGPPAPLTLSPGDLTVTIDNDAWSVASSANAPQGTQGTITFTGAASADVSVQHLFDGQSPRGPSSDEGGTISWSCAS